MMPMFLVAASSAFLRQDLGFDTAGLGLAVATFMGSSAACAFMGGRIAERIGAGRALPLVGVASGTVMLGLAVIASNLPQVVLLLALGGVANATAQPASNLAIARGTVQQGLAFGVRQSALPLATLLAGASVPLVSSTVGWRWTFVAGAALAFVGATFVPRGLAPSRPGKVTLSRKSRTVTVPLVLLAAAAAAGSAAGVSVGAFLIQAAVERGISVNRAGWLLVLGSVAAIVVRLLAGSLADRHRGKTFTMVSAMMLVGAAGYGMLALGGTAAPLIVGTLLASGPGWGWGGLLMLATVRLKPDAPAAASGIVITGGQTGSAVGPYVFGLVATAFSFSLAWGFASVATFAAFGLVLAARATVTRAASEGNTSPP